MSRVLHLLPRVDAPLAAATIRRDLEAGDDVTVALLSAEAPAPALPAAVAVHRVPADWTYDRLLEQIFAADRVVTW
jgi:hypothetical protein